MAYLKTYANGLRLIVDKMDGIMSVSAGIFVKTGSINEDDKTNGISHFTEHVLFKGTEKLSAFDISDRIDRMGAEINAFTAKEMTCYHTRSTVDHVEETTEILADIFFNSTLKDEELKKEKGVIVEEINMCDDNPEDVCFDLMAESFFGKEGLGRTILGSAKNVRSFSRDDVKAYMQKFYTADNVVISFSGNIEVKTAERLAEKYFVPFFGNEKSAPQSSVKDAKPGRLYKIKDIEQSHIGFSMKGYPVGYERGNAFNIANIILGGGMSSRLFQKIREELGLAYSVYSYPSMYKQTGILEIYAGVNKENRDLAAEAICEEVRKFKRDGITDNEFVRGREQVRSSLAFAMESAGSRMMLFGKSLLFLDEIFDFADRMKRIENYTVKDVTETIEGSFDIESAATATVGSKRSAIKI